MIYIRTEFQPDMVEGENYLLLKMEGSIHQDFLPEKSCHYCMEVNKWNECSNLEKNKILHTMLISILDHLYRF